MLKHLLKKRCKIKKGSELAEIIEGLNDLKLTRTQRRELIKEHCDCFSILLGVEDHLYSSVGYALANNLSGKEAYNYIFNKVRTYEETKEEEITRYLADLNKREISNMGSVIF